MQSLSDGQPFHELSEIEKRRQANLKRNSDFMESIGLGETRKKSDRLCPIKPVSDKKGDDKYEDDDDDEDASVDSDCQDDENSSEGANEVATKVIVKPAKIVQKKSNPVVIN